jgi:hypothetical protein
MKTKADALRSLRPSAEWIIRGDELEWLSPDVTQPTDAEIETEVARLQTEYDAQQYARDRVTEYPSIGDQLDALFHAGVFPAEMAATIQAVKDAHPKPTEGDA